MPNQPIVEIVQNATQQCKGAMFMMSLRNKFGKHQGLLGLGDLMLPLM
jgi:hypothetical protein